MAQKFDARQVISRVALGQLLGVNGTELDDLLASINKEFNAPLRLNASSPADSKINFQPSEVEAADLAGKSITPISSQIPTFVASTIDFQTGATTGGTINITFPNSTVGFYRRVGFSLDASGTIQAIFSAESATLGGLANAGTVFVKGALPIGWIDLEATAASPGRFKTAGSATNIIENKVGSDNRVHRIMGGGGTGAGGSGGSKNYLSAVITSQSTSPNTGNGNFEEGSTSGWSLFNTTLTSLIPTGSINAGAASVTTFNTVSSSQLAGSYSLQTASSAAWSAGQGFISDAFYIDNEDQNKVLTFKAYYKVVANPSNGNFSGTSSNTFAIYIYDVTNSVWIQPAGVYGLNQNSGVGYVTGTFQTSSNSTQYRIAVLAINASSGAITMYWDDFSVGPQTSPIGAVATDWVAYTPTFNGLGTVTNINVKSRRVGDSLEVAGYFQIGTPTASLMQMTLGYNGYNGGVAVDSNKIGGNVVLGVASPGEASTTYFSLNPIAPSSSVNYVQFGRQSSTNNMAVAINGNALTATVYISVNFKVPISGWSSNVQMSNDTDTRVISAFYNGQPTGTLAGSDNLITIPTKVIDTSASMSSGTYTVPVAGKYSVTAQVGLSTTSATANQYFTLSIKQNGTLRAENVIRAEASNIDSRNAQVHAELDCSAGDTITLTSNTNMTSVTYNSTVARSYVKIERLSGPSVVAASEKVAFRYTSTAGQSIPTGDTLINFETKDYDTHNAVTVGGSWKFTAPVSGHYNFSCYIQNTPQTFSVGNTFLASLFKNGSIISRIGGQAIQTTSSISPAVNGSGDIYLLAGDYVDLRVGHQEGTNRVLQNIASLVHFEGKLIK